MVKYCTCGNKIGLLNKGLVCKYCGKEMCTKCIEWQIIDDLPSRSPTSSKSDQHMCSVNCSLMFTNNKLESIDKNRKYILLNLNNDMVSIEEVSDKIGTPSSYSIAYLKGEPQNVFEQPMPQFMKKVYDTVKKKMESIGLQFTEECRTEY